MPFYAPLILQELRAAMLGNLTVKLCMLCRQYILAKLDLLASAGVESFLTP